MKFGDVVGGPPPSHQFVGQQRMPRRALEAVDGFDRIEIGETRPHSRWGDLREYLGDEVGPDSDVGGPYYRLDVLDMIGQLPDRSS